MDFFTVPTLTLDALYCFFVIAPQTIRIRHFNVTRHSASGWIVQQFERANSIQRYSLAPVASLIVTPSHGLACLFPSLGSGNSLVLQYPHHDAPILRLTLNRFVRCNLTALSHRAWRQHVGQGNMTLLQHEISDILGAFLT